MIGAQEGVDLSYTVINGIRLAEKLVGVDCGGG
jgi:hypothetical protein